MIDHAVISELQDQGVRFHLDGENIRIDGPAEILTADVIGALREYKPIIRLFLDRDYWQERLQERIGIKEHDGLMQRGDAEYWATREILWEYIFKLHPSILRLFHLATGMEKIQ